MSTYVKHSEDNSLTHYGVKGMKWKRHKYNDMYIERLRDKNNDIKGYNIHYNRSPYMARTKGTLDYTASKAIDAQKKKRNEAEDKMYRFKLQRRLNGMDPLYRVKRKAKKSLKASKKAASKGYKKLNSMRKRATKFAKSFNKK